MNSTISHNKKYINRRKTIMLKSYEGVSIDSKEPTLDFESMVYQNILNKLSDGIVVADKNGKFLFWNNSANNIVGLGSSDKSPEEWSEYYGCYYPDRITPYPSNDLPLNKAIKGIELNNIEIFIRNPKIRGGVLVNVNAKTLTDKTGEICGGVVIFNDITKNKVLEHELEISIKKCLYKKEFDSIENISNISKVDVLSKLFEPLNKTEPKMFNEVLKKYETLIDYGLVLKESDWEILISAELHYISKQLGYLKASPSDIVEIYKAVLKKRIKQSPSEDTEKIMLISRRLVLELLSCLASYYRNSSIASKKTIAIKS